MLWHDMQPHLPDSRYAWTRLCVTLALMTIGSGGMYVVAVVLPAVQAEFGVARADASLPYTAMMIGFGVGGIVMGKLADRFGVMVPVLIGAAGLGAGLRRGGLGPRHLALLGSPTACSSACSAARPPLRRWWPTPRCGSCAGAASAVAICASGNYLAGAIWPPIVQHFIETVGWRHTYYRAGRRSASSPCRCSPC